MIIDLCTQIWLSPDQLGPETAVRIRAAAAQRSEPIDGSLPAHEQAMTCVDGALVVGWRCDLLGAHIPNELVAGFVAKDPQRRAGVAGIDPMSPAAPAELERAAQMGLVGVAVSPACQGFHPAHSRAMPIYERCAELSMPVFVLNSQPMAASSDLNFGRPVLWDEVAHAVPELRLVIGHLGYPWIDEALVLIGKHRHVYAEVSGVVSRPWHLYNALLGALSMGVMDKILFGSGFPRESPAKAIENMYSVNTFAQGTQLPSVPRSQIRGIVERDSLSLLGIDVDFAARPRGSDAPVVSVTRREMRGSSPEISGNGVGSVVG
jgi:hypothetical protein